ncbi:MAG: HEAT repeat domain-containing protein [Candidatus Heimdallarchaeota archaeon]|nr:HEAT repeat domain-containing protein [Candidatus Heimdallarchaeota archaeon]
MSLEDTLEKLKSEDATTRVKAASDLGENGTEKEAPYLKSMVWEDPSTTAQQIAIQAYVEIMKEKSFEELKRVIGEHQDTYVKINAIHELGKLKNSNVPKILSAFLNDTDDKIRTTAIRSMILADAQQLAGEIFLHLSQETYPLAKQNCIEALGIWKYKKAKNLIQEIVDISDNEEIITMGLFALAAFGEKSARKQLEERDVDSFWRITVNNTKYRGKKGLFLALDVI